MNKRNIIISIVIVVLLGVGIGMNYYWEQSQVQLDDDGDPIPKATSPTAPTVPPPPTAQKPPAGPPPSPSGVPGLPPEAVFGNPNAKISVAMGYTTDAGTQVNPTKILTVVSLLSNWVQTHPDANVRIVSVDLPKDQLTNPTDSTLPLGISVNGKSVPGLTSNPGSGFTAAQVSKVLSRIH